MTLITILILALLLDALLGDPRWLWQRLAHPAALMGRLVGWCEARLNSGDNRRGRGVLALGFLLFVALLSGYLIAALPDGGLLEVIFAAILLAQNSLMGHVRAVARGLEDGLDQGRAAVAGIVGRDAEALDEDGVARAAIESAAENFSDGVVAPAFWFLLLGLPGIFAYKMVNTADSMIGYRSDRYRDFGWATARFDDLLNWIPARISGGLICASHLSKDAFAIMRRDAPLHRSPNAGWPEAATAVLTGVAISGPRSYLGQTTDEPFVNAEGRRAVLPADIDRAVRILWRSWVVLLAGLVLSRVLFT
jgi:adenosylcobinamide-phosphate synthase